MSKPELIRVWAESEEADKRSALPSLNKLVRATVEVSADALAVNLRQFLNSFLTVLSQQELVESEYNVESIELNLAVNAQGGIELIGKLSGGVTTSMKVHLVRRNE